MFASKGPRHKRYSVADVAGAQALGIPAVLIRTEGGEPDALAAAQLVTADKAPRALSS
jgi:hypothetical protein